MGFSLKTWKDRVTQYPLRRKLTDVDDSTWIKTVTVSRDAEGNISQEGDTFSATNMNDLEYRINVMMGGSASGVSPVVYGKSIKVLSESEYAAISNKDSSVLYFVKES